LTPFQTTQHLFNLKGGILNTQQDQPKSVHFTGLIATKRFNITPGGIPKFVLNIAEHPNQDDQAETIWHKNVVATRELALSLNNLDPPLAVGEEVEVKKGFPYSWPYTDKNGRDRENQGITLWIIVVRGSTYIAKRRPKAKDTGKDTGAASDVKTPEQ